MRFAFKTLTITLILAGLFACEEVKNLLTFTIKNDTTFTIENQFGPDVPFSVPTPDVTTNSSQKFENNNTAANLVKTIKLNDLELEIKSPEDFTFSFLKSLTIFISAEGVEETEVAYKNNISKDAQRIDLETYDKDLSPYIKKDTYDLRFKAVTREAFARDVTLKADMEFEVRADPL